jgi:hypothetical protein
MISGGRLDRMAIRLGHVCLPCSPSGEGRGLVEMAHGEGVIRSAPVS